MAYFTPYIDSAGLHIPRYTDIRDQLIEEAKSIFGSDIYVDIDSADYQFISVCALKTYDALQAAQLAYNSRGPQTAIGSGLDGVVKMNGITRLPAAYSTCQVELLGASGTVISNGSVIDTNGYIWDLPDAVTIGPSGTVTVSAVCETIGPISAVVESINKINTPTAGWTSVTNAVAAIAGRAVETDAQLRARQALSVALPSQTLLESTAAAIMSVENVTRSMVYENDTNRTSIEGFPGHSITCVVEGGTDEAVARQIFLHKGIGGYTNGTTEVLIYDSNNAPNTIRFYRPTYVPMFVTVTLKKLTGWSPAMAATIQSAIASFIDGLRLGESLPVSSLYGVLLQAVSADLKSPTCSIQGIFIGRSPSALFASDMEMSFYEAATCESANVTVEAN